MVSRLWLLGDYHLKHQNRILKLQGLVAKDSICQLGVALPSSDILLNASGSLCLVSLNVSLFSLFSVLGQQLVFGEVFVLFVAHIHLETSIVKMRIHY